MRRQWELRRVCISGRIFDKIREEMAQPVGIVLFGADCNLKNEVLDTIVSELRGSASYCSGASDTATLIKAIEDGSMIVVTLNAEESAMRGLRHELVKVLRKIGAKTIIGFYVKSKTPEPLPGRGYLKPRTTKLRRQIANIERSAPNADGLDYFVVVEEKEG